MITNEQNARRISYCSHFDCFSEGNSILRVISYEEGYCHYCSLTTREKTQAVAANMGYIPNSLASMDEALRRAGYNMMILCMQLNEELGELLIHTAMSQSVDGLLYFPYHNNRRHIDYMLKNHVPLVLLDRWIQGITVDCVHCNDEQGGYNAGRHLAALGIRSSRFIRPRGH